MKKLLCLALAASASFAATSSHALTTAEVVAKAKPCIVSIRMTDSAHPEAGGSFGTGFFIARDRIMTAYHVQDGSWNRISVTDLAGNQIHVASEPTYANGDRSVDLVIIKVTDKVDHPYLSFASSAPVEGQNVIVVGNPQGLTGTVSTGIVSAVRKNGELLQFTAPVSNGSSGCPVLNEDGDVLGLVDWIWQAQGHELAENLNFAIGLPVMQAAVDDDGKGLVSTGSPAPQGPSTELVVPTQFGSSRQSKFGTFVQVLDSRAIQAIARPVIDYLEESARGNVWPGDFCGKVGHFYDVKDVSFEQVKANDEAYFKKWPIRANTIDYANIVVEQLQGSGGPMYSVAVSYHSTASDGKKSKSGGAYVTTWVIPGRHSDTQMPDYFILSLWNHPVKS